MYNCIYTYILHIYIYSYHMLPSNSGHIFFAEIIRNPMRLSHAAHHLLQQFRVDTQGFHLSMVINI